MRKAPSLALLGQRNHLWQQHKSGNEHEDKERKIQWTHVGGCHTTEFLFHIKEERNTCPQVLIITEI